MRTSYAGIAVALLVFASGAFAPAQAATAGPYFGVMLSGVEPDSARRLDTGLGYMALVGAGLSERVAGELTLFAHTNDFEVGDDDIDSYGIGADLIVLGGGRRLQPFFLVGGGAQRSKIFDDEDDTPFVDAGVGLMTARLGTNARTVRFELRGYYHFSVDSIPDDDAAIDARLNAGLLFGGRAAAPPPPPAPIRAPAPVTPAKPPADSDRDGVADKNDRCPGTSVGVQVDEDGCAIIEKVVLKGVNFATGSARLKPEAFGTLRSVASAMQVNPELEVEVGGYADSVGDDAKNLALSERRAKAVVAFLVKEGVGAGRLTAKGYGEVNPVDTNDTPGGRANNRRVEFKVTSD